MNKLQCAVNTSDADQIGQMLDAALTALDPNYNPAFVSPDDVTENSFDADFDQRVVVGGYAQAAKGLGITSIMANNDGDAITIALDDNSAQLSKPAPRAETNFDA